MFTSLNPTPIARVLAHTLEQGSTESPDHNGNLKKSEAHELEEAKDLLKNASSPSFKREFIKPAGSIIDSTRNVHEVAQDAERTIRSQNQDGLVSSHYLENEITLVKNYVVSDGEISERSKPENPSEQKNNVQPHDTSLPLNEAQDVAHSSEHQMQLPIAEKQTFSSLIESAQINQQSVSLSESQPQYVSLVTELANQVPIGQSEAKTPPAHTIGFISKSTPDTVMETHKKLLEMSKRLALAA